ncbi:unnamed protein product [Rotaria sp. Silwood2]|nr:unnamed protein product [Rotaria sp. Silwood2]CAF2850268.1 unnamed protein product [Rotaria sp. Silwood2]CAF3276996.1 unnamed protein product [Rotaria sp. Silwood2]CAF3329476.1 unnamed protein product [Rotaria sp. Silwood2]CAF3979920.1 unnamed protein product [Rotaria sp. Silwood2]
MSSSATAQLIVTISQYIMIDVGFFVLFMGMIGNTISIVVLHKLRLFRGNPSVFYFTIESIGNLAQLLINYPTRIMMDGFTIDYTNISVVWCKIRAFLAPVLTLISIYTVCCASFDQYLSTHHQTYLRQKCTLSLAKYLTFTTIFFIILHGIPFIILFDLPSLMVCTTYNTIFSRYYSSVYYPVVQGALPMIIASSFSLLAFLNVRRVIRQRIRIVRRRLDRQLTAMVLARATCLVALILPYTLYRIYILNITVNQDQQVLLAINNNLFQSVTITLFYVNYAANFYIFMGTSSRYRHQVKHVIVKKFWLPFKHWLCVQLKCANEHRVAPEGTPSYESSIELE